MNHKGSIEELSQKQKELDGEFKMMEHKVNTIYDGITTTIRTTAMKFIEDKLNDTLHTFVTEDKFNE